ncbi:autotransporter domain-containing protein [Rhodanobacter sp. B04]|uniref:autotransporter serine protease n=1 Tax=Rhodanobacter sp. B04 TaxID=1945860 RepID=UPI00098538A9|nr:autotransporter serine protease [Rhodanobacter sp. B04]OOG61693.1 autotransporter domain-containing protein [Rhodanobacter sp. B04]
MITFGSGLRPCEKVLLVAMAIALSACGGGGSNVKSPPVTPAGPPAPPPASTVPPPIDAQLALTNTYAAHAQGYTGAGVTIGIVDSGIMRSNPTVAGRVLQELIYVDPSANNTAVDDVVGHGTWVAGIAAGQPFAKFPGGIAPGASLVSARIISDTPPKDDGSGQGNPVTAADAAFFAQTLNPALINAGVQVMNNSWGGIYWNTANASINQAFGAAYDPFVLQHGGLVVFAAGNDSAANPSDIAALPSVAPELEKGWLVAVAINSNNPTQLEGYSNQCGIAMNYCLAAPGDVIVLDKSTTASTTNPSYYIVEGTSFAAPQVSGAAALVWQAYPYFNNDLVRQTLLGTADPLGGSQPNSTFGYGELDVGKAVNGPMQFNWGDVTVSFSGSSSWNNPISGAGGLVKQGSGTLNLTQPSSYTGMTQVQGGTLTAKSLASSASISAGATLSNTPSIGGSVTNAGVLGVGGSNVTVGGNYLQQGNGRLAVSLGSALNVAGTATLAGGDLYVTGANPGYVVSSHTDVLTADGGLSGTFSALNTAPNVLLTSILHYDANNAWLDVQQVNVTAIQGASYTAASYAAAQRVQNAFGQLNSQLTQGTLTPSSSVVASGFFAGAASLQQSATLAAAQDSLSSLSGQLHAASAAMTFEAMDAGTRALSGRFDQLLDASKVGGWTQNLGSQGNMSRSGYSDVGYDLRGIMVGADSRIGLNGVVGYAVSQSQGLGRLAESGDQGNSHALEGMLYGGLVDGNWYAMGRFGMGSYRENMLRELQLGNDFSRVFSDSNGRYGLAYGESGYRFTLGGMQLTPYVNLQYAQIQGDGFNEAGADGFGLMSDAQNIERWQAGVGVRAMHRWSLHGGGTLTLQTRLLWQRALAMHGEIPDASFTGLTQWAPVGGIGLSRYGGVAATSLNWNFSPKSSLQLDVERDYDQYQSGNMAMVSYKLTF